MKKYIEIIFIVIVCVAVLGAAVWNDQRIRSTNDLEIVMLNIGQGDAIYIRTPNGYDILIDGGPDRTVIQELGSVMPPFDHTLDLVIASHPDADHIGGLAELTDSYTINTYIHSGVIKETGSARALTEWEDLYGTHVLQAYRGWNLHIEQDLWLEFIHPDPTHFHEEVNDDSVMFLLHYKEFTVLFTGDSAVEVEKEIIAHYGTTAAQVLDADVLKVGHHGSRTSTSQELLDISTPRTALINVGLQNKFGHPHPEPMRRLEKIVQYIYRTDLHGRIYCSSDGYAHTCIPQR